MKFEELNLKPEILRAIKELEFVETTEIQGKTIPVVMSGKDVVGQSQTGSGKTAAFGLPILNNILAGKGVQAIILTPTRELCVQVHDTMRTMGKYTGLKMASVYGGVSIEPQIDAVRKAEIVIGTPGRVLDVLDRRALNLTNIRYFILDEADRMLEMGFIDDILQILDHTPKNRQSLMFSATMPTQVKKIIQRYFKNPVYIKGQTQVDTKLLKQVYYNVQNEEKFSLLVHFLKSYNGISLIFCATREEVDIVNNNLTRQGLKSMAIHGGLTQNKRLQVVEMLKDKGINTLVATDVAARGLDIKDVTHVFNYDVPKSSEDYTHRIGRTARAGESGLAITLLTHRDYDNFSRVLSDRTLKVEKGVMPKFEMIRFDRNARYNKDRIQPQHGHQGRNFTNRTGGHSGQRSHDGRPSQDGRRGQDRPRSSSGGHSYNNRR
ncbi:MAG: DEAD/DEAH box helicase [Candidatus Woesearchaeota archaeon]